MHNIVEITGTPSVHSQFWRNGSTAYAIKINVIPLLMMIFNTLHQFINNKGVGLGSTEQ
jgi:hypothetical protein